MSDIEYDLKSNKNLYFPITVILDFRFISFEGRHWHSMCFICALCQKSMAGKGNEIKLNQLITLHVKQKLIVKLKFYMFLTLSTLTENY